MGVIQTSDGGYLIGGVTESYGQGDDDIYLIRINGLGDTIWTKTYGTPIQDYLYSLDATPDGGFIMGGSISQHSSLLKIDSNGNIEWTKTFFYGGFSARPCNGGGYILFGGGFNGLALMKTDSVGNLIWAKTYGHDIYNNNFPGSSFKQTSDNGYIFTGYVQGMGAGVQDVILVKTDDIGNIMWSKAYGGSLSDIGIAVLQLLDGGFLLSGSSNSFGLFGNYLIRTDAIGDTIWTRYLEMSEGKWLEQTNVNSEIIIAGGQSTICLLKINVNGDTLWTSSYRASIGDYGSCIRSTHDGGYIIAGGTSFFGHGSGYLIKTDENGKSLCNQSAPSYNILNTQTQITNLQITDSSVTNLTISSSLTVGSGAMDTTLCLFDNISEIKFSPWIILSPNPFHTSARLEIKNSNIKNYEIRIFNSMGVLVRFEKGIDLDSYVLSRGSLSDGLYFYALRTVNSELIGTGKFIIE